MIKKRRERAVRGEKEREKGERERERVTKEVLWRREEGYKVRGYQTRNLGLRRHARYPPRLTSQAKFKIISTYSQKKLI